MAKKRQNMNNQQLPTHAPPPWATRNEAYWLPLWLSNPLASGVYDQLEASSSECTTSGFTGGLGMIQIVRYTDTPCGSYDELLIIPGNFMVPGGSQKGKSRMRIARIYVSQHDTIYNGNTTVSSLRCLTDRSPRQKKLEHPKARSSLRVQ